MAPHKKSTKASLSGVKKKLNAKNPQKKKKIKQSSSQLTLVQQAHSTIKTPSKPRIQDYEQIYPPNRYWTSAVNVTSDSDVIAFLKDNLPNTVQDMLKETVFGDFFKTPLMRVSKPLIHSLILRELSQPEQDCMYIKVAGTALYFGIEHFLLISGLRAFPEDDFVLQKTEAAKDFCKIYFPDNPNFIKKHDIENLLSTKIEVEDQLKLALVYFIAYYLIGVDPYVRIPQKYFDCVYSGEYMKVAWGDLSYRETIKGLKKNGNKKKTPTSYRLEGCPLIFQLWFYEVCGACQGFLCSKNDIDLVDFKPRYFHWKPYANEFKTSDINQGIFNKSARHLNLTKIEATEQEIKTLSLQNFLPFTDPLQIDHQSTFTQEMSSQTENNSQTAVVNALESLKCLIDQEFKGIRDEFDAQRIKIETISNRLDDIQQNVTQKNLKSPGNDKEDTIQENFEQEDKEQNEDDNFDEKDTLEEGTAEEAIKERDDIETEDVENDVSMEENKEKDHVVMEDNTSEGSFNFKLGDDNKKVVVYNPSTFLPQDMTRPS